MAENKQTEPKFDERQITEKELQKYEQHYSDSSFLDKVTKYGKLIGITALYKAVQLWFVLQKPDVPAGTKAVIMGALGVFDCTTGLFTRFAACLRLYR